MKYDQEGHPYAIYASGKDRVFKTYAPVLVWLPPDVAKVLEEWRHIHPNPDSKDWILSHRSTVASGKLSPAKRMKTRQYEKYWNKLQKKYGCRS